MTSVVNNGLLSRLLIGASMALTTLLAVAAPMSTLAERMQLFRDGALRGFALSELPDSGQEVYAESDFQALAATGANVVRVPVQLRKCNGCQAYGVPDEEIRYVERILARGVRYGFRVVVVLLPTPWGNQSDYWDSVSLKADIVRKWGQLARRLKAFSALQAYDLINEPVVPGPANLRRQQALWQDLARAIAQELRAADPNTPLMIEPAPWGLPSSFRESLPIDMPGVVYSFHFYAPHEFTHQGLPGRVESLIYPGNGWDKPRLFQAMDDARQFAAAHNVPIFIGEFSCVRWAPAGSCPRYLADAISLFEAEGWGWAYHCWRCYQGWDAEVPEGIAKEQRAGHLPEHRQSNSPALLILKKSMDIHRKATRN